jgi:hypothetical protein
MPRSPSTRAFPVAVAAAWCTLVVVRAVPLSAAAALVPLAESHELTARGMIDGVTTDQVVPGSTSSPFSPVDITATAPASVARLYVTFDTRSIVGGSFGTSTIRPSDADPVTFREVSAVGTFGMTFSVTEAVPFTLSVELGTFNEFRGDVGRARLTFEEDGVAITGGDTGPDGWDNSLLPFDARGVLLPGRTYALTGAVDTSVRTAGRGVLHNSESHLSFHLMLPEPTFPALAAPGVMLLLARRRR